MSYQAISGARARVAGVEDVAGHPAWCARAHHCTAYRLPSGEHTSIPQVWQTSFGRVIATRYRGTDAVNRMELRVVLRLDPRERIAAAQCRHLLATACAVVARVFGFKVGTKAGGKSSGREGVAA